MNRHPSLPVSIYLIASLGFLWGCVRVYLMRKPETFEPWHGDGRLSEQDGQTPEDATEYVNFYRRKAAR